MFKRLLLPVVAIVVCGIPAVAQTPVPSASPKVVAIKAGFQLRKACRVPSSRSRSGAT